MSCYFVAFCLQNLLWNVKCWHVGRSGLFIAKDASLSLPAWFWFSLDQCICLMMLLREIYWLCSLSSKYCCITQIGSLCFLMMPTSSGNRNDLLLFLLSGKHHIHLPKVTFLYDYVDEFHVQKTDMLINMQIFWSPDIFLDSLAVLLICGSGCDAASSFPSNNNKSLVVAEKNLNEGLLMLLLWLNCLLLSSWPELWKPAEHYCK